MAQKSNMALIRILKMTIVAWWAIITFSSGNHKIDNIDCQVLLFCDKSFLGYYNKKKMTMTSLLLKTYDMLHLKIILGFFKNNTTFLTFYGFQDSNSELYNRVFCPQTQTIDEKRKSRSEFCYYLADHQTTFYLLRFMVRVYKKRPPCSCTFLSSVFDVDFSESDVFSITNVRILILNRFQVWLATLDYLNSNYHDREKLGIVRMSR